MHWPKLPYVRVGGSDQDGAEQRRFLPSAAGPPIRHGGTECISEAPALIFLFMNGAREKRSPPVAMGQPILPVSMNHDLARRAQSCVTVIQCAEPIHRSRNRTW